MSTYNKIYHEIKTLKRKGYPTSTKEYPEAHAEADIAEKKKYPNGYNKLKKIDSKLGKNELIGKNTKSGKIEVSKNAPKKYRKEIAYHEKKEHEAMKRLAKYKSK